MRFQRLTSGLICSIVLAFLSTVPISPASEPTSVSVAEKGWITTRTTPPDSLAELKALQSRVNKLVEKCSAVTVGIFIGQGAGSGVIVSEDGLVLTAAHVAGEPGRSCSIVLPDGTRLKGRTLGLNDKFDSGMVKILDKGPNEGKWPFLPIGKSTELKKGQWVVSLGHPGGWQRGRPPVARLGQVIDSNKDIIRTSCTIVGGDSGGPLFDLDGNVVGIHSRIGFSYTQNMHVPADLFKLQWDKLVHGETPGKPTPPPKSSLGVEFDTENSGAKIAGVNEDSPASKGGMMAGDIIVEFDGNDVLNIEDVRRILRKRKPLDVVDVKVERGGKPIILSVTLGKPGS